MKKKGFTAACTIKDCFVAPFHFATTAAGNGFGLSAKPRRLAVTPSHTIGRLGFVKCSALNSPFAFTLAEVLITLAIIGIVAALTIPTVVRNYQKQQLKVQFKKAYSTVMQTVSKTYADLGYQARCYAWRDSGGTAHFSGTECSSIFWPQFFKNLKVIKSCANNSFANGCIPQYVGREGIYQKRQAAQVGDPDYDPDYGKKAIESCPAWTSALFRSAPAYVVADGLIFSFAYNGHAMDPVFAVDINGKKPPNKLGYDVFALMFNAQDDLGKNIKLQEAYCFTADEGGLTTTQMLKETMAK